MGRGLLFLKQFFRAPRVVGAVAPSGTALARIMVDGAKIGPEHRVVELGAGTGPITRALWEEGVGERLLVLEPNPEFASVLRDQFPSLPIQERMAEELPEVAAEWGHPRVDRILSGLPWAIWPASVQDSCLEAIARTLTPDGRLVTFSYLHSQMLPAAFTMRRAFGRWFHRVETTRIAWRNTPPALAYVCSEPRSTD